VQLDHRCGSGLQAVLSADMMVEGGAADVVIAGGVESMSNLEYYGTDMHWGKRAASVTFHDRLVPLSAAYGHRKQRQPTERRRRRLLSRGRRPTAALGLAPMRYLKGWAVVGCEPATMGVGRCRPSPSYSRRPALALPIWI